MRQFPALVALLLLAAAPALAAPKTVFGRLENALIVKANVVLRAKIDTGARTSSLGVSDLRLFKRRGVDWVRFTFAGDDGRPVTLARKVLRVAKVKDNDHDQGVEHRPVILLGICIGPLYRLTQINLADRDHLNYPMLIGRRFLFGKAVVDVGRQFLTTPRCDRVPRG